MSLTWGGLDIGSAVGLLLSGPLIRSFGWPSVFYLFAVLGLLWVAAWPLVKAQEALDQKEKETRAAEEAAAAAKVGDTEGPTVCVLLLLLWRGAWGGAGDVG